MPDSIFNVLFLCTGNIDRTILGVKLCRPSEAGLDLIPVAQLTAFAKEDGEKIVGADGHRVKQEG